MTTVTFSIITACLNAQAFVAEAIESVVAQEVPSVEHVIVDGGSTDETLEILKRYPDLKVISEPDNGMYDAINKGIKIARGEWIGLLNADDLYPQGSLKQALDAIMQNPNLQAVNGGYSVFEDEGHGRKIVRSSPSINAEEFWFRIVRGPTTPNTWFIRRSTFEHYGLFDHRYRYAADREMMMRLALSGIRPLSLPGENYLFRQHEGSATFSLQDSRNPRRGQIRMEVAREALNIQEEYLVKISIPPEMRKELVPDHSLSAYKLAVTALYHRKWGLFLDAIKRGCRYDRLWPLLFLVLVAKRIQKGFGLHA